MDRPDPAFLSCPGSLFFGEKTPPQSMTDSVCVWLDGNVELLSPIVLPTEHWGERGTMHENTMEGI